MRRKLLVVALFLVASFVVSADYFELPVTEYPGGALWAKKSSIVIDHETLLTDDTTIRADELTLKAPVYTQGHALHIDVRLLKFEGDGKIVAFKDHAQDGPPSTEQARQGDGGESFSGDPNHDLDDEHQGEEKDGGQGHPGHAPTRPGPPGADGNQDPGEILVFAAKVEGRPVIDGTGQKGGKGGQGARGGKGGHGGNGSKADISWTGSTKRAGLGGAGGIGGSGGVGGDGGKGGRAVRVSFLAGHLSADTDLSGVVSAPGEGGDPGDYGPRGHRGDNGSPGSEDRNVWGGTQEGGSGVMPYNPNRYPEPPAHVPAVAKKGETGEHARPGVLGEKAYCPPEAQAHLCRKAQDSFVASLNDFEDQRFAVYKTWYAFHWYRALDLIVRDSFRLARNIKLTREQFEELSTSQELTDLNKQALDSVVAAWRDDFITPLSEPLRNTPISENREQMLAMARDVVSVLKSGVPDVARLAKIRSDSDDVLQSALDEAIFACTRYNKLKSDWLSVFFGATRHYTVPVCSGTPNFRDRKNLAARIELTVPCTAEVRPATLARELLPQPAPRAHALIEGLGLAPAYAGEPYRIIYVHDPSLSVPHIVESEPRARAATSLSGVILGYDAPTEDEATLENLPRLLRALAIQLGAQG